jgi:hypothetical protein
MTLGTVVLGVLQPQKKRPDKTTYLAAVYNTDSSTKISRTAVPIENELWQSIAIHTIRPTSADDMTIRCASARTPVVAHFVVTPDAHGTVLISKRWREQEPSEKFPGRILIGIQLAEGRSDATLAQAKALVILIRDLQARCGVSSSKVNVHTQSSGRSCTTNPLYRYNWREALLP